MSEPAASREPLPWSPAASALFEELMGKGPPEAFREAATRGVHRESERVARQRGCRRVEAEHVALSCLAVAPPVFRPNILADLAARGFDTGRFQAEIEAEADLRPPRDRAGRAGLPAAQES